MHTKHTNTISEYQQTVHNVGMLPGASANSTAKLVTNLHPIVGENVMKTVLFIIMSCYYW